jgi:hypothetical protein
MKKNRFVTLALALTFTASAMPGSLLAQQSTSLAGTAKDEAKQPYTNYTVRARDVTAGTIADTTPLNGQGGFSMTGLTSAKYIVELVDNKNKIVCTEGPFDMSQQAIKSDVIVDCNKKVATAALVAAALAAGVTAGVVAAGGPASPSR